MLIYFVYKNNSFNFNIKNDVSIVSLKNLASKLIQKDKTSFDLFYNNKILSEKISSLFQLTKNESSIIIIISLKKVSNPNKNNIKMKLPLIEASNKLINNQTELEPKIKLNLNLNQSENSSDLDLDSKEDNRKKNTYSKTKNDNKIKEKKEEYISINKVFEDVYNSKDEEIISLNKNFRNKILEYDDILYKKYKTSLEQNNRQLLTYEKNIINFLDKQIKFLKKLINYFDNNDSSFNKFKINLEEFYSELSNYNNNKNNLEIIDNIKKDKRIEYNNIKMSTYIYNNLPNISIIKNPEINIPNSNKISDNSINTNEILKERINQALEKKKDTNNKAKKITYLNKSSDITNAKHLRLKEKIPPSDSKKNVNENNIINKNISEEKKIIKEEKVKNVQNNSKKIDNKTNIESNIESDESNEKVRHNYDKNKIDILYQIPQNKPEVEEAVSENSDSNSENGNNFKHRRSVNHKRYNTSIFNNNIKKSNYKFNERIKERRVSRRLKKLGTNIYDFII